MKQRLLKVIKTGAVIVIIGCAYALFYMKTGFGIPCVFNLITGLRCPGCGITHMAVNLLRLDFAAAFSSNRAVFVMLPVLAYLLCAKLYRYIRYGKTDEPKHETVIEIIMIAVLVAFGILRNIISGL